MKNFYQTPKQRRLVKADIAKTKHKLATSKPIKTFIHQRPGYINLIYHIDGRR